MKTIYLAGGCFWGTEHFLSLIPGVISTTAGYANSRISDPDYPLVCSGSTGAAETVKVEYNPMEISLPELLELYYLTINPLSVNRQGNDFGTQYRTGIYYDDLSDQDTVEKSLRNLADKIGDYPEIESGLLNNFYPAEDYHQSYLVKNPSGYCHINPALFEIARKYRHH